MTAIGGSVDAETITMPDGRQLVLSWSGATDTGHRRRLNEDSFLARSPLFAVADGMGGHEAGGFASTAVVVRLAEAIDGPLLRGADITNALRVASIDINRLVGNSVRGGGTTVTGAALMLDQGTAQWLFFNIGDSRTYLLEGELRQVTIDHSLVQEMVDSGMLAPEDAEGHPESNVITRAVGFDESPIPDLWMTPVRPGQRLLVCSDGLTKELRDEQIGQILTAGGTAREAADALVAAALANSGRDNVTAVVVDVMDEVPRAS